MEKYINALKLQFRSASKEVVEEIDKKMEELVLENPKEFSKAMVNAARETVMEAEELRIKKKAES